MAGSDHRIIPVGTVEIADRFGVARTTVDHWRVRPLDPPFPEPAATVGGRPAWHWPDVKAWGMKFPERAALLKAAAARAAEGRPGRPSRQPATAAAG